MILILVTSLVVEIDKNLNFSNHISIVYQKASNRINAISRMQKYLRQKEKQILFT